MIPQEPDDNQSAEPEAPGAGDLEQLQKELAEAKVRSQEYLAGWQRAQADFINFKRRAEQEKQETVKYANARLIQSLLPLLDDLERAYGSVPPELEESGWVKGLTLIWRKLQSTLELQGLSEIKAVGEPFDPNIHEAVMPGKGKEGIVIGEVQKGYWLHEQVLRPTKAIVGSGKEKEEE